MTFRARRFTADAVCFCFLTVASIGAYGEALPYKQTGAGSIFRSDAADLNGDGELGSTGRYVQKGTLGNGIGSDTSDYFPWDGYTFCNFDPDTGDPGGVLYVADSASRISVASNGDSLFQVLSSSPPSTVCASFDGVNFTSETYFDIVGGTGKFEGATGSSVHRGSGQVLGPTHFGFQFEDTGTIDLNDN